MTSKQIYEATAIELSKIQAPALKLFEFNYFFNQAIRQFVNKVYNVYDVNQQTTDDLRVLKATATLMPQIAESTGNKALDYLRGATYFVDMPNDYLHLLNCICLFDVNRKKECWNAGDVMVVGATKLTADSWSSVVDDVYNQPTKKRPYYYVHNQNDIHFDTTTEGEGTDAISYNVLSHDNSVLPTNAETDLLHDYSNSLWRNALDEARKASIADDATRASVISAVETFLGKQDSSDMKTAAMAAVDAVEEDQNVVNAKQAYDALLRKSVAGGSANFSRTFDFKVDNKIEQKSAIEKPAGSRHANSSRVKVEIRCGRDKSNIFSLSAVQIDYVKAPQFIRLTQEQLDSDEDISQVMEFPDYVNQEIVNELVNLVMRKTNDPSLQAHMQMTQSIARPTGQQQQPAPQG